MSQIPVKRNVLITGVTGCVGHYLYDRLSSLPQFQLYLYAKNPQKIRFDTGGNPGTELIHDDMRNIEKYSDLLKEMDYVVHLATSWGGKRVIEINVDKTLALFSSIDPKKCVKIIYFSTSSILDNNHSLIPEALNKGTPYIQSKYICYEKLSELSIYRTIRILFPTVILGGDDTHPFSHASRELDKVWRRLSYLRFLKIQGGFHFIHAYDVAQIVAFLLTHNSPANEHVLGNPSLTVNECLAQLCRIAGRKRRGAVDITKFANKFIPIIFKNRLSSWDLYSLKRRYFYYNTVNAQTFGLVSAHRTLEECLIGYF